MEQEEAAESGDEAEGQVKPDSADVADGGEGVGGVEGAEHVGGNKVKHGQPLVPVSEELFEVQRGSRAHSLPIEASCGR